MKKNFSFPALRCQMGQWIYYLTFFKFSDIEDWIKPTDQIHTSKQLREMIQRSLTNNVESIAKYLHQQEERFFNSIVVGVYGGAPQWYPIEVSDSPILGSPLLEENDRNSIGVLKFDGDEQLFAIDGQHRVEGIKQAIRQNPTLNKDELGVILLAHETTEEGQKRTRRLFTTLNKWAKPVSKADIIALDEDDAFAIVTRRLVEEFPLLKSENRHDTKFIHFGSQPSLNKKDDTNLTTIRTLYEISSTIYLPILKNSPNKERKESISERRLRPSDSILDKIYIENTSYWNLLTQYIEEYAELFISSPDDRVAGKYRMNGGHFMFRPLGQRAFANAVRVLLDRNYSMQVSIESLSKVPLQLDAPPWEYIMWEPYGGKIIRNFGIKNLESILLCLIGQEPRTKISKLEQRYREYLANEKAQIPPPVTMLE